jgi:toxin ParE1/3/4
MAKVSWTFQALEDIQEITDFHAPTSPQYASFIVTEILSVEEKLSRFPKIGRIVPETNINSIREVIVSNYRVIYAISSNGEVNVLTVRSSRYPLAL